MLIYGRAMNWRLIQWCTCLRPLCTLPVSPKGIKQLRRRDLNYKPYQKGSYNHEPRPDSLRLCILHYFGKLKLDLQDKQPCNFESLYRTQLDKNVIQVRGSKTMISLICGEEEELLKIGLMWSLSVVLDSTWEAAFRTGCSDVNQRNPLWKK